MNLRFHYAGFGVLLLCLAVFALTASGHYGGDGLFIFETAESLVLDGSVQIGARKHQWPVEFASGHAAGREAAVSKYDIGMVLAEIPLYALGHGIAQAFSPRWHDAIAMLVTSMSNVWISAVAVWMFYILLRRASLSTRAALAWSIGLAFATPVWVYAKTGFREPLCMLFLIGVLHALWIHPNSSRHWRHSGLCLGFCAGGLMATRLSLAPVAALAAFMWVRALWLSHEKCGWPLLWAAAPGCLWIFIMGAYNWARFGSAWDFGLAADATGFTQPWWLGFWGMLGSTGKGLWAYAPLSILGVIALPAFARRYKDLAVFAVLAVLLSLLLHARFSGWTGGHGWGPRYAIFLLPLFLLSAASGWQGLGSPRKRAAVILGIGLGALIQIPSVLLNFSRFVNLVQWHNLGDDVFNPLLSAIVGNGLLLRSALQNLAYGHHSTWTLLSVQNHNYIFHDLRVLDLTPWPVWDLWWLHAVKILGS